MNYAMQKHIAFPLFTLECQYWMDSCILSEGVMLRRMYKGYFSTGIIHELYRGEGGGVDDDRGIIFVATWLARSCNL